MTVKSPNFMVDFVLMIFVFKPCNVMVVMYGFALNNDD